MKLKMSELPTVTGFTFWVILAVVIIFVIAYRWYTGW